jgi:hypothetical protein
MPHFIVEDGTGHSQANAYASVAYVLDYLTDRNRHEENGWADLDVNVKEATIIAATDYIEKRFSRRFKGRKEFESLTQAVGVLTISSLPTNGETIVIGSTTYVFRATLGPAYDVLIGTSISATLANLIAAISAGSGEGITYGIGTVQHPDVFVERFENSQMVCHANLGGIAGNDIATTTTAVGSVWSEATLTGGVEVGRPQPLSFPRLALYDHENFLVCGMPRKLLQATAEYAVRSAASPLQPDPDVLPGGQVIEKREKVSVIEEVTVWAEGGRPTISVPYPAADELLNDFLRHSTGVMRS